MRTSFSVASNLSARAINTRGGSVATAATFSSATTGETAVVAAVAATSVVAVVGVSTDVATACGLASSSAFSVLISAFKSAIAWLVVYQGG